MNIQQALADKTKVSAPAVRNGSARHGQQWQIIASSVQSNPDLLNPERTYAPQLIGAVDAWSNSRGDDVIVAVLDTGLGTVAQRVDGSFHATHTTLCGVGDVQRRGQKLVVGDIADGADLLQPLVRQDRLHHFQTL